MKKTPSNLQLFLERRVLDFTLQSPAHPSFQSVIEDFFFHHFQFDEILVVAGILSYQLFVSKLDLFVRGVFCYTKNTIGIFSTERSLAFLLLLSESKAKISGPGMNKTIRYLIPGQKISRLASLRIPVVLNCITFWKQKQDRHVDIVCCSQLTAAFEQSCVD